MKPLKKFRSWLKVKGRSLDHFSFLVRRLAGIVLVLYLFIHMVDISTILLGEEAYNSLLNIFASKIGLIFDIFLWTILVFHGSLGVYSIVTESGIFLEKRRYLLYIAWIGAIILIVVGSWVIINVLEV